MRRRVYQVGVEAQTAPPGPVPGPMSTGGRGGRVAPAFGGQGGGSSGSRATLAPEGSNRRPAAPRLAPASAAPSSTPTNRPGGGRTFGPAASPTAELSPRPFLTADLATASRV